MKKPMKRVRSEVMWMGHGRYSGFIPWCWGISKETCEGRIANGGVDSSHLKPVRVRITPLAARRVRK